MDEFLIATIVESYRERSLLPKFGDRGVTTTLTSDLETVLQNIDVPPHTPLDSASQESLIKKIVEAYRQQSLLRRFGEGNVEETLSYDLELVLRDVRLPSTPTDGTTIPRTVSPAPQQDTDDIYFSSTRYHVGSPDSSYSGSLHSRQGQFLIYLLEHIGEEITFQSIKQIGGWTTNAGVYNAIGTLASQVSHSRQFRLEKVGRGHAALYSLARIQG